MRFLIAADLDFDFDFDFGKSGVEIKAIKNNKLYTARTLGSLVIYLLLF
jgi:hypothetical protein